MVVPAGSPVRVPSLYEVGTNVMTPLVDGCLIVYVASATELLFMPFFTAIALIVVVLLTAIGEL